jgi:ABC-2 type transport system permease protein
MIRRPSFSVARCWAVLVKEFVQMRRDRLTFGMMIGIPLLQLVLFDYAINSDPRHLSTGVLLADHGPHGRTLLHAIRNCGYFHFVREVHTEAEAHELLARGELQFVVTVPEDFSRDLLRGDRPVLLLEADTTDPAATSNAIGALRTVVDTALDRDLQGPLFYLAGTGGPVELRVHARYNPDVITQYHIVLGLMGVVLTMGMILITGLAITRERERGTMETCSRWPCGPSKCCSARSFPISSWATSRWE